MAMPELPENKREKFVSSYGISASDARVLTQSRAMTEFYESLVASLDGLHKLAASWLVGEFSAALNDSGLDWKDAPVSSERMAGLLRRIGDNTISGKAAKEVFEDMWSGPLDADAIIAAKGLKQVSDAGTIEKLVDDAIAANPKSVEEYRAGKEKALNALFGQVMKASNKTANPAQVTEILKRKLAE